MFSFLSHRTPWQPIGRKNLKKEITKVPKMVLRLLRHSGEEHGERNSIVIDFTLVLSFIDVTLLLNCMLLLKDECSANDNELYYQLLRKVSSRFLNVELVRQLGLRHSLSCKKKKRKEEDTLYKWVIICTFFKD